MASLNLQQLCVIEVIYNMTNYFKSPRVQQAVAYRFNHPYSVGEQETNRIH